MNGSPPGPEQAKGLTMVGYHDLENRPAFKMGMQVVNERWDLYTGSLWHRGWSILDVTDPTKPELINQPAPLPLAPLKTGPYLGVGTER